MVKAATTISIEPTAHALVRRKGWNLSQLVEQAIWAKDKVEREKTGELDIGEIAEKAAQEAKQKVLDEFASKIANEKAETQAKEARLLALRQTYEGLLSQAFVSWENAKKEFGMKSVEALELAKQIADIRKEAKENGVELKE